MLISNTDSFVKIIGKLQNHSEVYGVEEIQLQGLGGYPAGKAHSLMHVVFFFCFDWWLDVDGWWMEGWMNKCESHRCISSFNYLKVNYYDWQSCCWQNGYNETFNIRPAILACFGFMFGICNVTHFTLSSIWENSSCPSFFGYFVWKGQFHFSVCICLVTYKGHVCFMKVYELYNHLLYHSPLYAVLLWTHYIAKSNLT